MAILVDESTRAIVQGITGTHGRIVTKRMLDAGTRIVAGVTPGKAGEKVHGVPVYDLVEEAMREHPEANAAISFVPARFIVDAAIEAISAGLSPIVITAEHVPTFDALKIVNYATSCGIYIIGPNTPGIYSPAKCLLGFHPLRFFGKGRVGLMARGGGISYEVSGCILSKGMGISTCVNIGGDRITGLTFAQVLKLFEEDDETDCIVIAGEIGGTLEEETSTVTKPVVALIVGRTSPSGKRMGHAGAIIEMGMGSYESKVKALSSAGAVIARNPSEVAELLLRLT